MGTRGYFAYRYNRVYYRQYAPRDSYPDGRGQSFLDLVPRNPSVLQAWIANTIDMLENTETVERDDFEECEYYQEIRENDWVFLIGLGIDWTYVIDLDNFAFTVNGRDHWRLDRLPRDLTDYYGGAGLEHDIPDEFLCPEVDLWPAPNFDVEERQRRYEALQSVVIPASEWGAPTWDELSISQHFSIDITHHLLQETSAILSYAYMPHIESRVGKFCWDMLCASIPGLPIFQDSDFEKFNLSPQTLLSGHNKRVQPAYHKMRSLQTSNPFKLNDTKSIEYFCVRGCLVTFCVRLGEPIYVAHEVEQMVRKIRRGGPSGSVGIILSSQQELVVVAVDGLEVRHSPVLDIRATDDAPGRASDGRLLLTHLLRPSTGVLPLPWRSPQPHRPLSESSSCMEALPPEVLRIIIQYADTGAYLALCLVSRSIRSLCLANPRVGDYTILRKVPNFESIFVARSVDDNVEKTVELWWQSNEIDYSDHGKWEFEEVSLEELGEP
ncbi:hypothetical protein RSOLAG22IIIB_04716 [Rhizoctonia solani]|uniref:F-box domain-containing protein n=1 Tax=Rhizoctonia solani TaxID=456999 RepID=A0A0K6FZG3_9AGAM|nr:hypothetical protein RSOLAG22IIIB_04716 [Rhizoctonia solani]